MSKSIFLFVLIILTALLKAQVPKQFSYQGILTDAAGKILPDKNYTLQVMIYDQIAGGSPLYSETQQVLLSNGVFKYQIGQFTPIPSTLKFVVL